MNSVTIVYCVIALIVGMLMYYLLKQSCGCGVVEGQEGSLPCENRDSTNCMSKPIKKTMVKHSDPSEGCKWCAKSPGTSLGKCVDADICECHDFCGTYTYTEGKSNTGACWPGEGTSGMPHGCAAKVKEAIESGKGRLSESEWTRCNGQCGDSKCGKIY